MEKQLIEIIEEIIDVKKHEDGGQFANYWKGKLADVIMQNMNGTLLKLMSMTSNLSHDGWIVLPPSKRKDVLTVNAEWYINRKKYCFSQEFKVLDLTLLKVDISQIFVDDANMEISRMLAQQTKGGE